MVAGYITISLICINLQRKQKKDEISSITYLNLCLEQRKNILKFSGFHTFPDDSKCINIFLLDTFVPEETYFPHQSIMHAKKKKKYIYFSLNVLTFLRIV